MYARLHGWWYNAAILQAGDLDMRNATFAFLALALPLALPLALGACTPLTANAPLFSPADAIGPPPLTEGVWFALDEERCTREQATSATPPRTCVPFTFRHMPDGAWRLTAEGPDDHGVRRHLDLRFVAAPVNEKPSPDAYSALYVAEYLDDGTLDTSDAKQTERHAPEVRYAVLAPVGGQPARELFLIAEIDCGNILREGPIEGVEERHDAGGALTGCVAANQAAVREAARRAVVENLDDYERSRLLFVHP